MVTASVTTGSALAGEICGACAAGIAKLTMSSPLLALASSIAARNVHSADPSVFVRFRLKGKRNTYFLVWTTTPWTLPGNVALAVGEGVDYVKVRVRKTDGEVEHLILADALR